MVKGGNSSFLSLIPKVDDPLIMADYRPISLVGCQYKILAKFLTDRLKLVTPKLISENRTAFVGGRKILYEVMVANEIERWAALVKKKLMLLKIDFTKAYDCIN